MTDNSNAMQELLSCPFCGGKANAGWFAITHNIGCDECGYSLDACKTDIGLSYEDSFTPEVEAAIAKFNVTRWNTRADLASAQVAVAYEAAAEACTYIIKNYDVMRADGKTYESLRVQKAAKGMVSLARQDIRALTPADAKAALDAMLRAERAKAYERAAEAAYQWWDDDDAQELRDHIRALAQEDE